MKTRGFIIGAFALVLVLVGTGANAYVGLGVSDNSVLPSAADFNWINNDIGTLTWGSGITEINIDVRVSAPDGDITYFGDTSYDPYEPGTLYGSFTAQYDTVTTQTNGVFATASGTPTTGSTFNNMYGYFYTITLGASYAGNLSNFGFDMGPATITEIGYDANVAYQTANSWAISGNVLTFGFPGAGDTFIAGNTGTVYVASEYWWGWSNAAFNSIEQTTDGYNNTGQLPAPNPEAPTVALFMLGIFGLHVWRNKGLRFMAKSQ